MDRPKRVPWPDWDAWQAVCDMVLRDNARMRDREEVCRRVSVWRARGNIPVAVDATVQLFAADVHLSQVATRTAIAVDDDFATLSEDTVRHAVSMVLVRFVNGTCDAHQTGARARSVAEIARSIGIPRVLVDVRHSSTHNKLPSVALLNMCINEGLEWLRRQYWQKQAGRLHTNRTFVAGKLRELVDLIASNRGAATQNSKRTAARKIVKQLRLHFGSLAVFRDVLIPVLLDGHQSVTPDGHVDAVDFLAPALVHHDHSRSGVTVRSSAAVVAANAIARGLPAAGVDESRVLWQPLFDEMTKTWPAFPIAMLWQLVRRLLRSARLLNGNSDDWESSPRNRALLKWLRHFLEDFVPVKQRQQSQSSFEARRTQVASTLRLMVEHVVFSLPHEEHRGTMSVYIVVLRSLLETLDKANGAATTGRPTPSRHLLYARAIVGPSKMTQAAPASLDSVQQYPKTQVQNAPGKRARKRRWRRCTNWEACPVGVTAIQAELPENLSLHPNECERFLVMKPRLKYVPGCSDAPPSKPAPQTDSGASATERRHKLPNESTTIEETTDNSVSAAPAQSPSIGLLF